MVCLRTKRTPSAAVDNRTCAAFAWPTLCHGHKLWVTHGTTSMVPLLFCASCGRYSSTRMQHLSRPCAGAAVAQAARAVIKRIFATPSLHPVTGELLEETWPVEPPAGAGPFAPSGASITPGVIEDIFAAAAPSRRSRGSPPPPHPTGPSGQAASASRRAGVGAALVGEVWPPDPSCQVLVPLPVEPPPAPFSSAVSTALAGQGTLHVIRVPGDGNCLFHALVVAASEGGGASPGNDAHGLRAAVVARFGVRARHLSWALDGETPGVYMARMGSPGVWGGELEIFLALEDLGRPVFVYSSGNGLPLAALLAAPPMSVGRAGSSALVYGSSDFRTSHRWAGVFVCGCFVGICLFREYKREDKFLCFALAPIDPETHRWWVNLHRKILSPLSLPSETLPWPKEGFRGVLAIEHALVTTNPTRKLRARPQP